MICPQYRSPQRPTSNCTRQTRRSERNSENPTPPMERRWRDSGRVNELSDLHQSVSQPTLSACSSSAPGRRPSAGQTVPRAPLIAEGEPSLDQLRTPDCCGRDAEIGVSGFAVQLLTELKTTNRRSGPLSTTVDSTELSTVAAKRLTSVSRPVPSGSW